MAGNALGASIWPLVIKIHCYAHAWPGILGINFATTNAHRAIYGLMAPKGTPPKVIETIYKATEKAVAEHGKDITAAMTTLGAEVSVMSPKEYGDYLSGQNQLFTKAIGSIKGK